MKSLRNAERDQGKTPLTESAFSDLYHRRLFPAVFRAGLQARIRRAFMDLVWMPVEWILLDIWDSGVPPARAIEAAGLPRRSLEERYGATLTMEVDPAALDRMVQFESRSRRRRLANRLVWSGDWDLSTVPMRETMRYRFMKDLWDNRGDLTRSERYAELVHRFQSGRPYRSYHKGVYLDTEEKVLRFLSIYLEFMRQIADFGYDPALAPDPVAVAIDRHGGLLKINKGLHRLAMAQVVGIKRIPVRVRGIHRLWWEHAALREGQPSSRRLEAVTRHLRRKRKF